MDTVERLASAGSNSGSELDPPSSTGNWIRVPITRIEDLSDAVHGAGLRAVQLTRVPVSGSLVFAERDGLTFSSGRLEGRVALRGPLSQSMVTVGLALKFPPGVRHWLKESVTGDMGVFLAGDEHDAIYRPGSLYATVTLSEERAELMSARFGRVVEARRIGSKVFPSHVASHELGELCAGYERLHESGRGNARLGDALLSVLMGHLGRLPRVSPGPRDLHSRLRIVRRCRDFIEANLQTELSIEALAEATGTSVRTLFRSFTELLGESPQHYIQRMRLHRIREDLLHRPSDDDSVTTIAVRWGVNELGRFAGRYREIFGERPSQTMARQGGRSPRLGKARLAVTA